MTRLVVDNVTVLYGEHRAVDDLSLEVNSGEIVAVVGPSGSGKSTLLRVVAGLQMLDSGRVLMGDDDVSAVATHKRDLGLMFQDHALFAHLNVVANIEYGLKFGDHELSRKQRNVRALELLELVGLASYGARRVDSLSGGEAQRVALARALAPKPGLLMLDEPLGSLDQTLRVQLIEELSWLLREVSQTALYVTHDQTEAFALADRIAIMDHGKLLAIGQPGELWTNPGLEFVAKFLGHRNIWTVDKDNTGQLRWEGQLVGNAVGSLQAVPSGSLRVAAPTPAFSIVSPSSTDPKPVGLLTVVVDQVEFDQGTYRLSATVQGEGPVAPLHIYIDSQRPVAVNDRLSVVVDVAQLSVLEPIHEP